MPVHQTIESRLLKYTHKIWHNNVENEENLVSETAHTQTHMCIKKINELCSCLNLHFTTSKFMQYSFSALRSIHCSWSRFYFSGVSFDAYYAHENIPACIWLLLFHLKRIWKFSKTKLYKDQSKKCSIFSENFVVLRYEPLFLT